MRQTRPKGLILLALLMIAGCRDSRPAVVPDAIVSLTPAGTDLLVAMGLTDRIVGVSPYEANVILREKLPKVGDYLRIDWERLAELRPKYLLMQGKRDRLPPGVRERAEGMGITTIVLQIDRLKDIDVALKLAGDAIGQSEAAAKVIADLEKKRESLKPDAAANVPAMVVFSEDAKQTVGHETFIDDALTLAGGQNVIDVKGYVAIDSEKLASLKPRVVFLILPNADATAIERGQTALKEAGLNKDAKIVPITDVDALMPGTCAYRLAATMAKSLKAAQ